MKKTSPATGVVSLITVFLIGTLVKDAVSQASPYHLLSLDGGGSRGAMEAVILQDVMACLTLVKKGQLSEVISAGLDSADFRKKMRTKLDKQKVKDDLLHPGDVFDMIAGTSTGALMAFGLIHGKDGGRMSLSEVIDMYDSKARTIFPTRWNNWLWGKARIPFSGGLPLSPYSQAGLESVLREKFGSLSLRTVPQAETVVAAVARRHNHPLYPDQLEIFDTRQESSHSLVDVLKASACAPIYFQTPATIAGIEYIDGGVGGNCPLIQAIPRMAQLTGEDGKLGTVLSLAPPREARKEGVKGLFDWLPWFASELTDGHAVYHDQELAHPEATFLRLTPTSVAAKAFKMDSLDIAGMVESVRLESVTEPAYMLEVLVAALVLAPTVDLDRQDRYRELSKEVENYCEEKALHIQQVKIIKARLSVHEKLSTEKTKEASYDQMQLAWCYLYMGKYKEALEAGETSRAIDPLNTAALDVMAATYQEQGLYDQAIDMHKLCLHNKRTLRELPPDHPEIGVSLNNLGICYDEKGQHDLAIETYKKALLIYTSSRYGSYQKIIAQILHNLGCAQSMIGQHAPAIETLEKSLQMRKEIYTDQPNHPEIANTYQILGVTHCNNGQYDLGTPLVEESLRKFRSQHKEQPSHPELANVLSILAVCYLGQGQLLLAEQRLEESLRIYREVYPGGHDMIDEVQEALDITRSKKEKEEAGREEL